MESLGQYVEIVERSLERVIGQLTLFPLLKECIEYATLSAGKRLRPALALGVCEASGGSYSSIIGSAVGLELLHCASLIHDDLPALDNDDYRRGRPSAHRAFGEAAAILAGDALPSIAIEIAMTDPVQSDSRIALAKILAGAYTKLCTGQMRDLDPESRAGNLMEIHREKTGALFSAALSIGMIGAGFDGEIITRSAKLGTDLGVAFQIKDDLLDSSDSKGRPAGSDDRNTRVTSGEGKELLARICKDILDETNELEVEIKKYIDVNKEGSTQELITIAGEASYKLFPVRELLDRLIG